MNWQELNDLDFDNIGQWPRSAKVATLVILCALLAGLLGQFLIRDSLAQLEQARAQEASLKATFETKARQASALPAYEQQMKTLQVRLEQELRKLPNQLEIAGLLDDISFIATNNGLRLERINWEAEQPGEFSTELPMRIIVRGDYHQLGRFVAGVAALPRIVILDSFSLSHQSGEQLAMSMLAKTYKYNEQGER
ncbi:type IV pilus biogenesis protein PilO [Oceanimonas sp. GK1]|uniref:type 4a pilus biogenesis protein PilO n=1 Tax=Oceanimonas sp. (strain GK1 / IBRC-M 10197) TaxID=511062 RepID=UPI00024951CF|nr:type 4a pilus biogenesis protein PilO [Oceanimonas sp. GK1]AEY02744.1 type IV pilus biogenesis protein PilO [Oceanimonas sp. GK1]